MKVGTDGVLLGAWAGIKQPINILDIGTGTGLIALMLAQRFPNSRIDAIDISPAAFQQSADNFRNSPWNNRLRSHLSGLAEYQSSLKYDLIVSNPPYFAQSYRAKSAEREIARNADHLPLIDLFSKAAEMATECGELCLVLPFEPETETLTIATRCGWFLLKKTYVLPKPHSHPKRVLLNYGRKEAILTESDVLTIENENRHEYTVQYIQLTEAFYLKF